MFNCSVLGDPVAKYVTSWTIGPQILSTPGGTEYLTVLEVSYKRISVEPFREPPGAEALAKSAPRAEPIRLTSLSERHRNNPALAVYRDSAGDHRRIKTVARVAARNPVTALQNSSSRYCLRYLFVLLGFQRASRINHAPAGL